jgi:hypothetical protein
MSVVTSLPLSRLVTARGDAARLCDVGANAIRDLLEHGPVCFVVADVGVALRWVAEGECFTFWKHEVQAHLAEPDQKVRLGQFPGEYAYFASRWDDGGNPVVLLSKAH